MSQLRRIEVLVLSKEFLCQRGWPGESGNEEYSESCKVKFYSSVLAVYNVLEYPLAFELRTYTCICTLYSRRCRTWC